VAGLVQEQHVGILGGHQGGGPEHVVCGASHAVMAAPMAEVRAVALRLVKQLAAGETSMDIDMDPLAAQQRVALDGRSRCPSLGWHSSPSG
jgi:hypothetical protein